MSLQNITIGEYLKATSKKHPKGIAIQSLESENSISWEDLDKKTDKIAKGMLKKGLRRGDNMAIWCSNKAEWVYMFLAASKIGVCTVTINTNYLTDEVERILKLSNAKAIVFMEGFHNTSYVEIIEEIRERHYKENSSDEEILEHYIYVGEKNRDEYTSIDDFIKLGDQITDEEYSEYCNTIDPEDVINIQFTSGTTGDPKGVMLSHYSLVNNSYLTGKSLNVDHTDCLCLAVPFFHCFGLSAGILLSVGHGITMTLIDSYKPESLVKANKKFNCTILHGVPTMFHRLLKLLEENEEDYSAFESVRTGLIAGAATSEKLLDGIINDLGIKDIQIAYGQTETSPGVTQTTIGDTLEKKVNTVGRVLPYVDVKIQNVNNPNKPTMPGEIGEICVKGYNVMSGYYENEEKTKEVIDSDGWLHTEDLGFIDEDGYLHITGRIKDMIIRGGENIFPREIEELLLENEDIVAAEVTGVPSETYGEEIGVCIILKSGSCLTEKDVKECLRGKIAHYKIPKYVEICESFPLLDNGKIRKCDIRDLIVQGNAI